MLRDPVIQSARLMPTEEEGVGQGEESENPLVGPGITITQPDKIQPIKVSHVYHMYRYMYMCLCTYILSCSAFFLNVKINITLQFGSKKNEGSQDPATSEVHSNIGNGPGDEATYVYIYLQAQHTVVNPILCTCM